MGTWIQIMENHKILPGQEARFEAAAVKEGQSLKAIHEKTMLEDSEYAEIIKAEQMFGADYDWTEEGGQSIKAAAGRLGSGSFSVEE